MTGPSIAGATALVTGGAGTIGSTIVDQLLAAGAGEVRVLDNLVRGREGNLREVLDDPRLRLVVGDIRDVDLVNDLTAGCDLVFHQAAIRITQCAEEPRLALEVLVDGTFNVLDAAQRHHVAKVVAASSASAYGLAEEFPTTERHHPYNNDTFYGAAKTFNEGMLKSFRAMYGMDYVALRYFNVYGPRMDIHGLYTEVLIRWMERITAGQPPLIFGTGLQTMDFVYTTDIARANLLAATSEVTEGVYNVASGVETSLKGLAEALLAAMDSDLGVEHGPDRPVNGVTRRLASTEAARRDLGFEATVGLTDGLRRLVSWWQSEQAMDAADNAYVRRTRGGCPAGSRAMSRLNVMMPYLGAEEIAAVTEVIESGWVAQGPRVAAFEAAFAKAQQAEYAVATSSCTTALHLALVVAGVKPGDDVVVPSFSFIATANAAVYVGARPVFADVDAETGNLTAELVAAAITPATTAVIVVDQGGVPVDLDPIRALCDPLGITVVEDSACAAGSTYRGRPVGAGAEITAWSFHPRKIITTGEGGMITTSRADWADRARRLREHAMSVSAADRHGQVLAPPESYVEVGFNFRMTDLQAAVGLIQLDRLPEIVGRRRELAATYTKYIAEIPDLRAVADPSWGTSNFQSFWVEVAPNSSLSREELLSRLAEADISARRGIMSTHRQPPYASTVLPGSLPVTERLTDNTLILPLFHQMSESEQARVIEVLIGSCGG